MHAPSPSSYLTFSSDATPFKYVDTPSCVSCFRIFPLMRDLPGSGRTDTKQVEAVRSRYEQSARAVAGLEERRAALKLEMTENADLLPMLERQKRVSKIGRILSVVRSRGVFFLISLR